MDREVRQLLPLPSLSRLRAGSDARSGTIPAAVRLVRGGGKGGNVAMSVKYLAATAIAALVAGAGLAVHSLGPLPPEKQSTPVAAHVASLLAGSVDPFWHRSGG